MHIASIGIDLGKTTFHLVALGERNKVLLRKKFSRPQLLAYTANLPQRGAGRPINYSVFTRILQWHPVVRDFIFSLTAGVAVAFAWQEPCVAHWCLIAEEMTHAKPCLHVTHRPGFGDGRCSAEQSKP